MFSVSFFSVTSGSHDIRACKFYRKSVKKTAFLGFSSHTLMVSVAFSSARTSAVFEHIILAGADSENGGLPGRQM